MGSILKQVHWYLGIILMLANKSYAQYPMSNRLIQDNKFAMNVTYAAEEEYTHLALVNSYMPSKLPEGNNYFWQQGTFEIPINDELFTGTRLSNVKQGIFSQQVLEQALAYKLMLSENESLSLGIGFGINMESIDSKNKFSSNQFVDIQDPLFKGEVKTQIDLRMEVGAVYKRNDFEASIAVPFLIKDDAIPFGLTAYTCYKFYMDRELEVTPSVLLMKTYGNKYEITGSVNFTFTSDRWFQVGYLDSKQLLFGVGIKLETVHISYNFSMPFDKQYSSLVSFTHQLAFGFYL
jgi:type IX secretion system PorP/SprF family membrane protein